MSNSVSRRNFMKVAGTAAGVAVATGYSPLSYAKNETIKVASIGTGGQGGFHLHDGLGRATNLEVIAVCDVYEDHLKAGYKGAGGGDVKMYYDYHEMLDEMGKDLDAVVIATPLDTHYQIAMDCLDLGKHVFCQKTMTYDIEQSRDLVKKVHETGKVFQIGHQRRYDPTYNKALKMARDGVIGRIYHIDAQWHRNNEWRRPLPKKELTDIEKKYIKDFEKHYNWRLYRETSGGLMTELGTHAFDVFNWILDANPTRVVGYGGLDYWRDGRDVLDNVNVVFEFEMTEASRAYQRIEGRNDGQKKNDALNAPYCVRAVYSSITANGMMGASEKIQGDEGTMKLTEMGSRLYPEATSALEWKDAGEKAEGEENAIVITTGGTRMLSNAALENSQPLTVNTDKTVDQIQFEAFANDIMTGGTPKANVMVGLKSAILALAGMMATREQREVKIDPAWYEFDFDTGKYDTSMYSV
jgi:predicted dehydrogenase